jgi:hypothetical protein
MTTPSEPASAPRAPHVALDFLALVALQALLLQGFQDHVDLHPADEVSYQRQGMRLLAGDVDRDMLALAPVYSAAYGLLQLLPLRGAAAQDTMGVLLAFASSLSLWWALRPLLPRPASLLVAAWWSASLLLLANPTRVYSFTAVLATLAVGFAARSRGNRALLCLGIATLNRPELLPWLLVAAAGLGVLAWRRRARRGQLGAATAVAACLGLLVLLDRPELRHRAWFTVRWDFAAHFDTKDTVSYRDGEAQTRADAIVNDAFPGCRSLGDAIATNPEAVVEHVGRNLRWLPGNLADLLGQSWFHLPAWRTSVLLAAAAAAAAGAWLLLQELRRRGDGGARGPEHGQALVVVAASATVLAPLTLFLPRPDYLMPLAAPLFLGLALPMARSGSALMRRLRLGPDRTAWLALGAVVAAAVLLPGPFVWPPATVRANRDAVALLRRQALPADARVIGANAPELLLLAGASARTASIGSLLGTVPPVTPEPCFLLLGPWDVGAPYGGYILNEVASDRWELVDARSECWWLRRR